MKNVYSFKSGNVILPFSVAVKNNYSILDIAEIIQESVENVEQQFKDMIRESNFKLFD